MITPQSEPLVSVAFDLEPGREANRRGLVLDVDQERLQAALMLGGMSAEQCVEYPVIVKLTNEVTISDHFQTHSPENKDRPAITVKVRGCDGHISGKSVTHEARHLSDYVNQEHPFLTPRERRTRKAAATLIGLSSGGVIGFQDGTILFRGSGQGLAALSIGSLLADVLLCGALIGEYRTRTEERRARASERTTSSASLMIVESNKPQMGATISSETSKLASSWYRCALRVRSIVKDLFVPDYSL